jgi:D-galactarolactone cycloisomerase
MRIDRIEIYPLRMTRPPFAGERGADDGPMHVILKLTCQEGLTGLGSVYTREPLARGAIEVLAPHLKTLPADEPTRVRETLDRRFVWEGHGGALSHTLAGIDIALWDLLGQAMGQPISKLLGGRCRERIRPYASILMADPALTAERVSAVVARGFKGVKIGWGPFGMGSPKQDEAIVHAARETAGEQVALMVDAGASDFCWPNDLKWALETARMLAHYGVEWFEEPLPPDDLDGYCHLSALSPVPIAGGEVLCRRQQFLPWIERGAVEVVQPDTTRAGGISECRQIAEHAIDRGIRFAPHGWNTAVGLAADLQLVANLARADWVEFVTPSAFLDDLVAEPFHLEEDGALAIPENPGLGVKWSSDGFERHTGHALI